MSYIIVTVWSVWFWISVRLVPTYRYENEGTTYQEARARIVLAGGNNWERAFMGEKDLLQRFSLKDSMTIYASAAYSRSF
jgi:hypothetical protein